MATFEIIGAHRETGREARVEIEAKDPSEATELAAAMNLLVSSVRVRVPEPVASEPAGSHSPQGKDPPARTSGHCVAAWLCFIVAGLSGWGAIKEFSAALEAGSNGETAHLALSMFLTAGGLLGGTALFWAIAELVIAARRIAGPGNEWWRQLFADWPPEAETAWIVTWTDADGRPHRSRVEADSKEEATGRMTAMGRRVVEVRPEPGASTP